MAKIVHFFQEGSRRRLAPYAMHCTAAEIIDEAVHAGTRKFKF